MTLVEDEIDATPWMATYRKQQRHHLKRGSGNQIGGDELERSPAAPSGESNDSKRVLPKSPPTFRQKVATLPESTVGPALIYSVSDDSDDEGGVSAPVSPATGKTKAEVPSLEDDVQDDDQVIISAMASLVVSPSPKKPTAPPVSPFTSPVKSRKFYVVSVGKCTGVFDSWPVVHQYTSGVPGNCQKSYTTYREAMGVYQDLKEKGLVRVVRTRGDDVTLGALEDAIQ